MTSAKDSGVDRYIALAFWCLGKTYHQLGDHHSSYDHLQEAYQLFNTLLPGEVELQWLSGQCGIDLISAAQMALPVNRMGEVVSLVEKKCAPLLDDIIHGRSLVILGSVLNQALQPQEALHYLDPARTILKAAGNVSTLAKACQFISWVHYDQGRLQEALDAIEEAWKHAELTDSSHIQATVSLTFGMILFGAGKDAEAWKQIEIVLMKAAYTGDRLGITCALEYMGYGYLRSGDYQMRMVPMTLQPRNTLVLTMPKLVGRGARITWPGLSGSRGILTQSLAFPGLAWTPIKTLFYPPVQASASELPVSSS